ncbi:MAG: methyltransferase domain-containing protein [Gammaproteobacteria bacterium]|nr:methyltransferase domain-containing protein [Gammaproteobacteria bacterium]MBI5615121.1 methyltransferase domain-containing protein [Gammaproteobacteria bacterium]
MRLKVVAGNLIERLVLKLNAVPEPLLETQVAFSMARAIMTAVEFGLFEAVADAPAPAASIAAHCGTHPGATGKLLNTLAGCGYVRYRDGGYALTPKSRKWLLRRSPHNLCDKLLFQLHEWDLVTGYEHFVRTGEPYGPHAASGDHRYWQIYQRGMRSLAALWAHDVAARVPMPRAARDMLDIGGSHGYYSVCLCRRHPALSSVILDLPEAVEHARAILAEEGMGERVTHRVGNALTDDLGQDTADIVFMSQLVHHFTDEQNRMLMKKIARALRPGGVCVMLDSVSPTEPGRGDQTAAVLDLYFAMLSESGTWPVETMCAWLADAGLEPLPPRRFRNMPGGALVAGRKSA